MSAWLGEHLDRVRARPPAVRGETLTATLAAGLDEGAVTREQAVGMLVVLFGAAGESTASLLGTALALMLRTPGLQQQLRARPALLEAFVEEAVRLESPFKFHYRVVRQATKLCGTALQPGDRLLLGWGSANRDAAAFADADALRLDRPQPQRHLGFGYGIHFCIGAPLARLEVRVALEELLAQTRDIALLHPENPAFVPSIFVRRLERLALRLEPRAAR
jgi:cytochrome P450